MRGQGYNGQGSGIFSWGKQTSILISREQERLWGLEPQTFVGDQMKKLISIPNLFACYSVACVVYTL